MLKLPEMFYSIQRRLFPELEEELGELTLKQKEFVRTIELVNPERYAKLYDWKGIGCKPYERSSIIKAFILKPIYQYKSTRALIEQLKISPTLRRLCGWESVFAIPSESVFSRVYKAFASTDLGDIIHEAIVKANYKDRLVGHISRDSTSVESREKSCRKNTHGKKRTKKRGRPVEGEEREKVIRRLEIQPNRGFEENLVDLPTSCDWGTKKNSNGKTYTWKGYKLHLDCADGGVPVSAIISSASMHDSQAAIPLMQMSTNRVINFYDVMDSAYDAPEIHNFSRSLNHIPVIDNNPRRGEKIEFDPAKKIRYNERTTSERANSELKDNYGLEDIRVKGHKKVKLHIMFAIIALTSKALFNILL
jgi:hypothetical protein